MAFAEDYIEVPARIAEWYRAHPDGRITCEIVEFTESRVTVRASVYRTPSPDEPPAGVGHSFLEIPGKTPYTKGSELENAETSAAGRALVMAGVPAKNVASSNEVQSKRTPGRSPSQAGKGEPAATTNPSPAAKASPSSPNRAPEAAPSAGTGVREGAPEPAGVGDPTDTSQDMADLLIAAVKKCGTLAKVVSRAHALDPSVRTEADLLGWHLIEITEGGK